MGRTKKVKSAGKFGTRYGMKARKRYAAVDRIQKLAHECPSCKRPGVKRVSTGIWRCRKCKTQFIGGAYVPRTSLAKDTDRIMRNLTTERLK